MSGTVCYTSFTLSYLSRASILARSLRAAHPDWELCALLVDEAPAGMAAAFAGFDRVVVADSLAIPAFRAWMFKHDLVEACTAVKPPMLAALLAAGAARVVYLDPDIAVFHPLTEIVDRLDRASIVLTPHQCAPSADAQAARDNEMTSLLYGIYNLGFLAVRNDASGRGFADWWTAMTRLACYDDVTRGIFTDQKYCDLVPGLFEGVHVERDPGCNVASWNLGNRRLRFTGDGDLTVNDRMLKFYHFTKIGGIGDAMTERYAQEGCEVFEIVNWYKRQIARHRLADLDRLAWCYGRFDDGQPIPRAARLLWRERPDLWAVFPDPFAADGFRAWLERERPECLRIEEAA